MKNSLQPKSLSLVFSFLGGLVLLFILAPLLRLLFAPGLHGLFASGSDPDVMQSIAFTLSIAFASTFVSGLFVVPLAWVVARKNFRFKNLLNAVIDLPVMIPHSAAGIALLGLLNRNSTVGAFAQTIGISFVDSTIGVAVAMTFVSLPFLYHAARDTFETIGNGYEKVAENLGTGPWRVFFTISLPLAQRGILSGFVMMFGRAMSEFGAVVILAYHPMITPVMIYDRLNAYGLQEAQRIAALFLLISLAVFVGLRYLSKKTTHARHS